MTAGLMKLALALSLALGSAGSLSNLMNDNLSGPPRPPSGRRLHKHGSNGMMVPNRSL
jgi:hypothetical protein